MQNLSAETACRSEKLCYAPLTFEDERHRTAILTQGSEEEQERNNERAETLRMKVSLAVVVRNRSMDWLPRDDDVKRFGIEADRQPLHQFFVIDTKGLDEILPDVNTRCRFHVKAPTKPRQLPTSPLPPEHLQRVAEQLFSDLLVAEKRAFESTQRLFAKLLNQQPDGRYGNEIQVRQTRAFIRIAAPKVLRLIRRPSPEVVQEMPHRRRQDQLAETSRRLVVELGRGQNGIDLEENPAWYRRVSAWVVSNGRAPPVEGPTGSGEAWPAVRMAVPDGLDASVAIFAVGTPKQRVWVHGLESPPVSVDLPAVDIIGDLADFLGSITGPYNDYPRVRCTIEYRPDNTAAVAVNHSVRAMSHPNIELPGHQFWKWSAGFGYRPPRRNLLAELAGVRDLAAKIDPEDPRRDALSKFGSAPCGVVMGKGTPGSGLVEFAIDIVQSVVADDRRMSDHPQHARSPVVWLAPDRSSIERSVGGLAQRCPNSQICEMASLDAERDNLRASSPGTPTMMNEAACIYDVERQLVALRNAQKQQAFEATSPARRLRSLSEFAKRNAQTNHDRALVPRLNKPARDNKILDEMLRDAANKCDVLCSTPEAIFELNQRCPGVSTPDLVVINDAARMTKGRTAIAFAQFPNAAFLIVGDVSQCTPVTSVPIQGKYKIVDTPTYTCSLLERADSVGMINFELPARQEKEDGEGSSQG